MFRDVGALAGLCVLACSRYLLWRLVCSRYLLWHLVHCSQRNTKRTGGGKSSSMLDSKFRVYVLMAIVGTALAFLAPSSSFARNCRKPENVLPMKHETTLSEVQEANGVDIPSQLPRANGPGHVSAFPVSSSEQGRKELTRIVLALAVMWVTVKVGLMEILDKFSGFQNRSDSFSEAVPIVDLADGVRYQDVVVGRRKAVVGELVVISVRVFHNGLELLVDDVKGTSLAVAKNNSVQREKGFEFSVLYGTSWDIVAAQFPRPLVEVVKALPGMNINSRRKVTLSTLHGIPPFVPEDSCLLCDVSITSPTNARLKA